MGQLKYFLWVEVAQSMTGIAISQKKRAFDILEETGMCNYKLVDTPMDLKVKPPNGLWRTRLRPKNLGEWWKNIIIIL